MPLDPECPAVQKFNKNVLDDPITRYYGMGDELSEDFEKDHGRTCERCQEYGAANIEVLGP